MSECQLFWCYRACATASLEVRHVVPSQPSPGANASLCAPKEPFITGMQFMGGVTRGTSRDVSAALDAWKTLQAHLLRKHEAGEPAWRRDGGTCGLVAQLERKTLIKLKQKGLQVKWPKMSCKSIVVVGFLRHGLFMHTGVRLLPAGKRWAAWSRPWALVQAGLGGPCSCRWLPCDLERVT